MRALNPQAQVEVLIPDCRGDEAALNVIFDARPDVLNHNIETVARLQRAVRPSASYARSLSVLAQRQGGRSADQVVDHGRASARPSTKWSSAWPISRGVGTDIVTVGQYLRPTA